MNDIIRRLLLQEGAWANPNPSRCPCQGNGWLLSNFDAWHRCPLHGEGVPHPEEEWYNEEYPKFDYEEHLLDMQREAYRYFRGKARKAGFTGNFKELCRRYLKTTIPGPKDWVDTADEIATSLKSYRESRSVRVRLPIF